MQLSMKTALTTLLALLAAVATVSAAPGPQVRSQLISYSEHNLARISTGALLLRWAGAAMLSCRTRYAGFSKVKVWCCLSCIL